MPKGFLTLIQSALILNTLYRVGILKNSKGPEWNEENKACLLPLYFFIVS